MSTTVKNVIKSYKSLSGHQILNSGKIIQCNDQLNVFTKWTVSDVVNNKNKTTNTNYSISNSLKSIIATPFSVVDDTIMYDIYSKSGRRVILSKIKSKSDKYEFLINIYDSNRMTKSINVSALDEHDEILNSSYNIGRFEFSNDGLCLHYVAIKKDEKTSSYFETKTSKQNDLPFSKKNLYKKQYGEQMEYVTDLVLCTLNIENEKIVCQKYVPPNYNLATFDCCPSDNNKLALLAYKDTPYQLGLIYCIQRESNIFLLDMNSKGIKSIGMENVAKLSPRFSNNGKWLIWLENKARGPHMQCQRLMRCDMNTLEVKVLVDVVYETNKHDEFTGIHCLGLIDRCWSDDDSHILLSSQTKCFEQLLAVDTQTGQVKVLKLSKSNHDFNGGSVSLLDISGDNMLLKISSIDTIPFPAIASIGKSIKECFINWIPLDTIHKLPNINWKIFDHSPSFIDSKYGGDSFQSIFVSGNRDQEFSTIQELVKNESVLELFCRCMSIRGVSKFTSHSLFLRSLWSSFILLMTIILMYAIALLILDYLKYDVTLHQRDLKQESSFPTVTICHHHPFSKDAYKLWDAKKVLSPSEFNKYMRNKAIYYLKRNDTDFVGNFYYFDSVDIYYQNLMYNESIALGHKPSIILYCMKRSSKKTDFENDCQQLSGYSVRRFSHNKFFNCFSFEPSSSLEANTTEFFSLIVSLGRAEPDYANHEQAFLTDVFEMARGLRVVVHEPGTMPNLEGDGLHVEPGKMNEINFQPELNIRLDTPIKRCIIPNKTLDIFDLDSYYTYQTDKCREAEKQLQIIKHCRCIFIFYPRPFAPNSSISYCGRMWPNIDHNEFSTRLRCVETQLHLPDSKETIEKCAPRCNYFTYEATVSITKWRVKQWHLHWLRIINVAYEKIQAKPPQKTKNLRQLHNEGRDEIMQYLTRKNLSNLDLADSRKALNLDGDDFAYVVVKRKRSILKEQREKEVLSLTVLLSRIGGFCSLLIGLTIAAIVEFIEFIYLLIQRRIVKKNTPKTHKNFIKNNCTNKPHTKKRKKTHKNDNTNTNNVVLYKTEETFIPQNNPRNNNFYKWENVEPKLESLL